MISLSYYISISSHEEQFKNKKLIITNECSVDYCNASMVMLAFKELILYSTIRNTLNFFLGITANKCIFCHEIEGGWVQHEVIWLSEKGSFVEEMKCAFLDQHPDWKTSDNPQLSFFQVVLIKSDLM